MNDEHEDNGGRHAPASQEDLITGLADALPDPSDDSSGQFSLLSIDDTANVLTI